MKRLITAAGLVLLMAAPVFAQQVAPVKNRAQAAACAPADIAAAVVCLDQHLTPASKAMFNKPVKDLQAAEIVIGQWVRNEWGLWSGSPLAQFMISKRVYQIDAMSARVADAYWLKARGCKYDWNDVNVLRLAVTKAAAGDPCSVTPDEIAAAGRAAAEPAPARAGRAPRGGAATPAPTGALPPVGGPEDEDQDDQ